MLKNIILVKKQYENHIRHSKNTPLLLVSHSQGPPMCWAGQDTDTIGVFFGIYLVLTRFLRTQMALFAFWLKFQTGPSNAK